MTTSPEIKKWVFSFDERAAGWFEKMIKVGVISAKDHTSLQPICLFDGNGYPEIIRWLESRSVEVIRTRVPFYEELFSAETLEVNKGTPYEAQQAAGAYLRIFAPDFIKDEFFIYTDCDIMFQRDLNGIDVRPKIIAACGETLSHGSVVHPGESFNSGVMIINRQGFLEIRDEIIELARSSHFYNRQHSSYDQTILNLALSGRWERLPSSMNWRPFEGIDNNARIIHFHGPKPHRVSAILDGSASPEENKHMLPLIMAHRASYDHFVSKYQNYLSRT